MLTMRIEPWLSGVVAGVCFFSLGTGQALAETKFEMGLRLGYGIPFGKGADAGNDIKDASVGQIPVWFELGPRFDDRFFVGGYVAYGFGISSSKTSAACDADKAAASGSGVDIACDTHDARLGAEFLYHILPKKQVDPWVGIGFGYERFGISETGTATTGGASATVTYDFHGFEIVNLQLGSDVAISKNFALGPFLAFTLAEYRKYGKSCTGDCAGQGPDFSGDIHGRAFHEWLLFGARVTWQP